MTDGVRIADMPDLGAVTDACSVVGEHAGSGRFAVTALRDYVAAAVRQFVSLADFGGIGNDGTDNSAAFAAAFALLAGQGGGGLFIPPAAQAYRLVTGQTVPANVRIWALKGSVTIKGMTAGMTMFRYSAGTLTDCNITFDGLMFDAGAASITAISCTLGNNVAVSNCEFAGIARTVDFDRVRFPDIRDIFVHGNAGHAAGQLLIHDSTGIGALPCMGHVENYIVECAPLWGTGGAANSPLILLDTCETINIRGCQATGLDALTPNSIGHIEVRNLSQGIAISDCVSVGATVGIKIAAVTVGMAPSYIGITNCDVDSFGTAGIQVSGTATDAINLVTVQGGFITGPGATAPCIDLAHTGFGVIIDGVTFFQWIGFPTASGLGVRMGVTRSTNITGCYFSKLTTALVFAAGTNSFLVFRGNRVETVTNFMSGAPTARADLSGNMLDTAASPVVAPSLPASLGVVVNDTGFPLQVNISGGNVTTINLNGVTTGLTSGSFVMQPGGNSTIQLVYSVAPTWAVGIMT